LGIEVGAIPWISDAYGYAATNLHVVCSDSFNWEGSVVLSMAFMTTEAPVLNLSITARSMIFVLVRNRAEKIYE